MIFNQLHEMYYVMKMVLVNLRIHHRVPYVSETKNIGKALSNIYGKTKITTKLAYYHR